MAEKKVAINVALYSLEALHKACYPFLDEVYIKLEGDPAGVVTILIGAKRGVSAARLTEIASEIPNELLHQALRVRASASNQKIREYIVTRALASAEGVQSSTPSVSKAPILDDELEREIEKLLAEVEKGEGNDPLKIAAPYDEKKSVVGKNESVG